MLKFDAKKIAEWAGGAWGERLPESITGFCFDARSLLPGQCFVAFSGGARDGHEFLEQAAANGGSAALVEQTKPIALPQLRVANTLEAMGAIAGEWRRQFTGPVVGVTGSCGKTSTKEMLRVLLGAEDTHATAGNWNNRIGVPMTLLGLDPKRHRSAVIEAGINQPGEMAELGRMIQADLTVLTNIGHAHLELLGDLEGVAREKSLLAKFAQTAAPLFLPVSALTYSAYSAMAPRAIVLQEVGLPESKCPVRETVRYRIESLKAEGPSEPAQQLTLRDETYRIASRSRGIALNAALAIEAARYLGVSPTDIKERIESWRPTEQRGQILKCGRQIFYVDCYNANPTSMADALDAFCESTTQSVARLFILGAMNELGHQAESQHQQIGQKLRLGPDDRVAFVGPKTLTRSYAEGALRGGAEASQVQQLESIEKLKSMVAQFEGAIFLKGSRSYQLEKVIPDQALV